MILWLDLVLEYWYKLRVKGLVVAPPIHPLPQWDIGHCYTWAVSVYGLDISPYDYHINVLIIFLEVHVYILPNLLCNMNDNFQRQRKNLQRNNVQTVVAISVGTKNISVSSRINFANISYTKFNFYIFYLKVPVTKKEYGAITDIDFCPTAPHYFAVTNSTRVRLYIFRATNP